MAKFYGLIGYITTEETSPGIWEEAVVERNYSGDVIKDIRRWQTGAALNDDLIVNNIISIVADPFAYKNLQTIRYITWLGADWKVLSVEVQRPRLLLSIGGVYNGKKS